MNNRPLVSSVSTPDNTNTEIRHAQTILLLRFEPMIPTFERWSTVHILDHLRLRSLKSTQLQVKDTTSKAVLSLLKDIWRLNKNKICIYEVIKIISKSKNKLNHPVKNTVLFPFGIQRLIDWNTEKYNIVCFFKKYRCVIRKRCRDWD